MSSFSNKSSARFDQNNELDNAAQALILLLAFISSTFATDFQIKSVRQKRQLTSGISCTALTVPNGMVNYLQTNPMSLYAQGTTALLQCNLGFTVTGTTSSICTNGAWSPALGYCTQNLGGITAFPGSTALGFQNTATCLPMLAPLNGRLQYSVNSLTGTYTSGTSVQVMCNTGYTPSGSQTSTCMSVGTTTGSLGGNTGGALCPAAIAPLNGQIQYNGIPSNGLYSSGSSATLICNAGTFVSGSSTSFCSNGLWTPAFGMCTSSSSTGVTGGSSIGFGTGTQCGLFPWLLLWWHSKLLYRQYYWTLLGRASATLMCTAGTPTGTTVAVCQSGQWQPSFFTGCSTTGAFALVVLAPLVLVQVVLALPWLANVLHLYLQCLEALSHIHRWGGQWGPFPQSTIATLQCLNGQMASGSTSASCMNGFWSPASLGPCGSTHSHRNRHRHQQWVKQPGQRPVQHCQQHATSCIMGLVPPLNGRITYSNAATFAPFPTGTVATLVCNAGTTPSGQTTASCMNGMFNPSSLGTCIGSTGFSPSMSMTNSFATNNTTAALATNSNCYDFPLHRMARSAIPSWQSSLPFRLLSHPDVPGVSSFYGQLWNDGLVPSQLSGCGSQALGFDLNARIQVSTNSEK
uniref:Sushi domain-containing protein n=1 Tax=Ditylenchus dipsaci TaxID=166011 RepID=A0A915CP18_9BILA